MKYKYSDRAIGRCRLMPPRARSDVTRLTFAEMCTGFGHYKRNRIMSMSIHDNRSVRQSPYRLAERQRLNQLFISARSAHSPVDISILTILANQLLPKGNQTLRDFNPFVKPMRFAPLDEQHRRDRFLRAAAASNTPWKSIAPLPRIR